MPVYVHSSDGGFETCGTPFGCTTYFGTNYLLQGDASAALLMRF